MWVSPLFRPRLKRKIDVEWQLVLLQWQIHRENGSVGVAEKETWEEEQVLEELG